jgi:hypothetical protein
MAKESLANIMDAADPTDGEDVVIRKLLVAALSESGIELAQMIAGRDNLPSSCDRGVPWRVRPARSPSRRRGSPVVAGRCVWH